MFAVGTRVRLKHDPAVIGHVTAAPPTERANRVFVEIELPSGKRSFPGNQLEEVDAIPDAVTDLMGGKLSAPEELRRTLTHLRMTGRLADMIYSLGATNTEFHAYQFKPVLKLLNSPSRGLLIADEVGLGKTIEAGLVWTELVARFESRRLLVVCPKPLVQKWRDELRSKFNVEARVCGALELMDLIRDDAQRRQGFAAIASMPALRPPKGWNDPDEPAKGMRADLARHLSDASEGELFDLVVFDEAHHLRNVGTMNHQLGQLVTSVSDYTLFLSATPINLRANDLRALLKLIDPDTFDREWLFDILLEENAPLVAAWEAARNPNVPLREIAEMVSKLTEGQVLKTGERLKRLRTELRSTRKDSRTRNWARREPVIRPQMRRPCAYVPPDGGVHATAVHDPTIPARLRPSLPMDSPRKSHLGFGPDMI